MRFFKGIPYFFKNRAFRVDILTIFLVLISLSILSIIGYTYSKTSSSIFKFSQGTIERVGQIVLERIGCMVHYFQAIPEASRVLITSPQEVCPQNQKFLNYIKGIVQNSPNIAAFYVGTDTNNLLGVFNLKKGYQSHYVFTPSKPLPEESEYAINWVDNSSPQHQETWTYVDKNFKVLSEETTSSPTIDPVQRPWYLDAEKRDNPFWTPIYYFSPSGQPGVTVSLSIRDASGKTFAVLGADVSLTFLEEFLGEQQQREDCKVYILNREGKVLISGDSTSVPNEEDTLLVSQAYLQLVQRKQENFITRFHNKEYLVSSSVYPTNANNNWMVMIIAPMDEFFAQMFATQKQVYMISLAILILSGVCVVYFSKRVSSPIVLLAQEVDRIKQLDLSSEKRVHSNIKEINMMDHSVYAMKVALRTFEKYLPKEILKQLMRKGQEIRLGGEKKEITVFFSDIAGFTGIAETLSTDYLMPLLAEYFDGLSTIILKNEGTIDKYIGDSVMAFWGAPIEINDHVYQSCKTALLCKVYVAELNMRRRRENKPEFPTRIGINTGTVIIGNIGTKNRMNYTVIGDSVNIASRLQSVNKRYHTHILVTQDIYEKVKDDFLIRPLDIAFVEGRKDPIKIYELMGFKKGTAGEGGISGDEELCHRFTQAYHIYEQGDIAKAKELFSSLHQAFPQDYPSSFHLKNIQEGIKLPQIKT